MNTSKLLLAIATLASVAASRVLAAPMEDLQLSAGERAAIENAACRKRHDVALDRVKGRVYGAGRNAAAVGEAHCASNQTINGSPAHYVVQCARSQGVWDCQSEWSELLVPIAGSEPVEARVEGEMTPAQATNVIRKIAAAGRFQGYELRKALASPCYVTQMKGKEFIDVKCEGWHIIVSTWCPQASECPRLLSIDKD